MLSNLRCNQLWSLEPRSSAPHLPRLQTVQTLQEIKRSPTHLSLPSCLERSTLPPSPSSGPEGWELFARLHILVNKQVLCSQPRGGAAKPEPDSSFCEKPLFIPSGNFPTGGRGRGAEGRVWDWRRCAYQLCDPRQVSAPRGPPCPLQQNRNNIKCIPERIK